MRRACALLLCLVLTSPLFAQNSSDNQAQVPHFVRFSGKLSGTPTGIAGITFGLYRDEQGGSPLWLESQSVTVDADGRYSVLLGSTKKDGLPADIFTSLEAKWLGIRPEGQEELPRVLLVSVPYALKAGDAETLGGLPASAFLQSSGTTSATSSYITQAVSDITPNVVNTGTTNFVARYVNTTDIGASSLLYDKGTSIGINTTNPEDLFHINGNILLKGQTTHSIKMQGVASTGRLGQDLLGFFFAVDTPGKTMRVLTTPVGGSLTDGRFVVTSTGNVGIGTSNPNSLLSVTGTIESTSGGFKFPDGSTLTSATTQGASSFTGNTINQVIAVTQAGTGTAASFTAQGTGTAANFTASNSTQTISAIQNGTGVSQFNPSGVPAAVRGDSTTNTGSAAGVFGSSSSYLGYGVTGVNLSTCDPNDLSHCNAMGVFGFSAAATRGAGVWGEAETTTGDNAGVVGKSLSSSGTGVFGYANATSGDATGVYGLSTASGGAGIFGEVNSASGTPAAVYGLVSAGTGAGAQLDVQTGNIIVGRSWNGSAFANSFRVAADGTTYGKVFNTSGADFAESVAVNGGKSLYNPGDVLIVDESGTRRFALANERYSTKVAGIYATKPGVLASTHQDGDPQLKEEVPLAIVGIVPCKVSAENGAIRAGDLLVASSRAGYAMKGTDRSRMLGAVIGKALGALDKDTGVIEVLVSLH